MKNLVSNEAIITEKYKNKALVNFTLNGENVSKVVKLTKTANKGDTVTVYQIPRFNVVLTVLYSLLPLLMFALGMGLGFLLNNEIYHYVLAAGSALFGFGIVVLVRFLVVKYNPYKYIAE